MPRSLEIDDLRQYVFGLFLGREKETVVDPSSLKFLGTAFFVTKCGDAITAEHILPSTEELEDSECVLGILGVGGKTKAYRVVFAASFAESDLAIFRLQINNTLYLEVSFESILMGTDVIAFGISDHQIYGSGLELRTVKGYTTMPVWRGSQELSFMVPAGMSGGPVLLGTKCVGFLIGNVTSEQVIDQIEEVSEATDNFEKIKIVESREVLHYGVYRPFSIYEGKTSDIFDGDSLDQLIRDRNK